MLRSLNSRIGIEKYRYVRKQTFRSRYVYQYVYVGVYMYVNQYYILYIIYTLVCNPKKRKSKNLTQKHRRKMTCLSGGDVHWTRHGPRRADRAYLTRRARSSRSCSQKMGGSLSRKWGNHGPIGSKSWEPTLSHSWMMLDGDGTLYGNMQYDRDMENPKGI
jgi:hypothetical protein